MTDPSKHGGKPPNVYSLSTQSRCYACDSKLPPGAIVKLQNSKDEREVLCQNCAGLNNFIQLPAGNAKLSRLAPKYSPTYYVILKWSQLWKCYERQGLLIEKSALARLEQESDDK
jgi:hypothetical protein